VKDLLYIDRTQCTGCGVCVDVCPTGAISLDESEGVSTINSALCSECLLCLDVCPNGAIQQAESFEVMPVVQGKAVEGEIVEGKVIPAPAVAPTAVVRSPGRLATLAGTALTFVEDLLLPRAADALVGAVERSLARRTHSAPSAIPFRSGNRSSMGPMAGGRGGRSRQRRRRRRGR
jgi:NAD-dependent dihydropyrimidine dehydrogenase PreA subunit